MSGVVQQEREREREREMEICSLTYPGCEIECQL